MNFRSQKREEVSIDLTPLIDVVFLLLIFFMVSTTFTKETHLEIDLPESSTEATTSENIELLLDELRASDYMRICYYPDENFIHCDHKGKEKLEFLSKGGRWNLVAKR